MAAFSITVATPAFGEIIYTPYVQSLMALQRAALERGWTMRHMAVSHPHINEARNTLLTLWYDKSDATHLLFVDADMGFSPDLIFNMLAFDKPVVGVIYTKRKIDLQRLAKLAAKGETFDNAIARAHEFIVRPLRGRRPHRIRGFMEVAGCGTGIMLIQRSTIARMLKILPDINDTNARKTSPFAAAAGLDRLIRAFDNITVDGVLLMNDFAFCHRWQNLCKGELWASTDEAVTHIGLHKFSSSYADAGLGQPNITVQIAPPADAATTVGMAANRNARRATTTPRTVPRKQSPADK